MKKTKQKKVLRRLGKISLSLLSTAIILGSAGTSVGAVDTADAAKAVIGAEGGKEAVNQALKVARGKPAFSVATLVVCISCFPVAGAVASPGMCIACGILIAKTFG